MNKKQLIIGLLFFVISTSIIFAEEVNKITNMIIDAELSDIHSGLQSWTDQKMIENLSKIPLTEESIKKLYIEFKNTVVNPLEPETYAEYSIKNGEEALERTIQLGHKIHNMLFAVSDSDIEKYGSLLNIMRDILYLDSKHIPLAIKHDNSRDAYWYKLHIKWVKEAQDQYNKLFLFENIEDINIDWDYLKTCNRHFWASGDLNNDGVEEDVGIFLQWLGEGWWSDDIGYVICIFDKDGKIIYGKEVIRYQPVENLSIKDINKDGLKEIVISVGKTKYYKAKVYLYGWKNGEYSLIKNE